MVSSKWYCHFRCVWPGMAKLIKITSVLILCNIVRKKYISDEVDFLHAEKRESMLQIDTMILMGDGLQSKQKMLQLLLCSIVMQIYCDANNLLLGSSHVSCYLFLDSCDQKWVQPFRSWNSKIWYIIIGWVCSKMSGNLLHHVSQKWCDRSSRLIEWFLHADSDWIIFVLTTNLLCVFDICWVSTAVVLVKYLLCFVACTHRKSFRTWFSQKLSIKPWLSEERLFPV